MIIANIINYQDQNTAMNRAAEGGHTDCVRLLVEAGADKEVKNSVRAMTSVSFNSCVAIMTSMFPCCAHFNQNLHTSPNKT